MTAAEMTTHERGRRAPVNVRVTPSFEQFVASEQRGLVALAFGLTGSLADAQEVVQDVLMSASRRWRVIGRYDTPVGWARRAVMNRSTSVLRRRSADAKRIMRIGSMLDRDIEEAMPDESADLWSAVRALPRRQAQAVTLRALFGMSVREIAETLDISKATAQVHLDRGLTTLRGREWNRGTHDRLT